MYYYFNQEELLTSCIVQDVNNFYYVCHQIEVRYFKPFVY